MSRFPTYDVEFSRYSAGPTMHLRIAEFTPAAGVRVIDMGTGVQRYKDELKNGDLSSAPALSPRARCAVRCSRRPPERMRLGAGMPRS